LYDLILAIFEVFNPYPEKEKSIRSGSFKTQNMKS